MRRHRGGWTAEMDFTLRMMYAAGETYAVIAQELGVDPTNARSRASRLKLCNRVKELPASKARLLAVGERLPGLKHDLATNIKNRLNAEGKSYAVFASSNGTSCVKRLA